MSMHDPISDLLSQINNAYSRNKDSLLVPSSSKKKALIEILIKEGYLKDMIVEEHSNKPFLKVSLGYYKGKPVIRELKRLSKPGLRRYADHKNLPSIKGGLGVAIVSTNKGLLTDRQAKEAGIGGEILCSVF